VSAFLTIDRLRVRYDGRDVLRALSLEVARGEIVALMGPSGVGKTTVLRAVAALQSFDEGRIHVDGFALAPGPVPPESRLVPLRRRVGLVFQAHALFEHLTVLENVTLALRHVLGKSRAEADGVATALLDGLEVGGRVGAWPRQLSGGEAQRVAIARALAPDPKIIVGDEPTGNLDTQTAGEMFELLQRLNDEGKTVLYVTHDLGLAAQAGRMVTIRDGLVVGQ
jgi:ABC-type polar amino acid transport system ATPase subunit